MPDRVRYSRSTAGASTRQVSRWGLAITEVASERLDGIRKLGLRPQGEEDLLFDGKPVILFSEQASVDRVTNWYAVEGRT